MGALVGAHVGAKAIPPELKTKLYRAADIEREIDAFVAARVGEAKAGP